MLHDELSALLARVGSDGDLDALAALFDRTAPGLLKLALRLTGDPVEAEDVLQDTFVAVMKGAHTYDPARPAGAWLGTVLANAAARRNRRKTPGSLPEGLPEAAAAPLETKDDGDWRSTRAAIERLPPRERSAMLLRYEQGLSPKRIAEILDVSESSVRSMLARGTGKLRGSLAPLVLPLALGPRLTASDVLARVRDKLLTGKAVASAAAGAAVVATVATGGIVMTAKSAAAIAALVLIGGTGSWIALRGPSDPSPAAGRDAGPPHEVAAEPGETPGPGLQVAAGAARVNAAGRKTASPAAVPRYSGRVHDQDDRVVPGVTARVIYAMAAQGKKVDLASVERLEVDAEGRFGFDIPDAVGQVTVRIEAPGHVPLWGGRDVLVFVGRPSDVILVKSVDARVHVVDAARGQPVAGATVRIYGELTAMVDGLRSAGYSDEAATDAAGQVVLHAKVGNSNVVVRAAGFANLLLSAIDVPRGGADVTARLARGTRIEGRLVDADDRGRADFHIAAFGYPLYEVQTRTDASGRFLLEDAPSSAGPVEPYLRYRLDLYIQFPGQMPRWFRVEPPAEGETKAVTLVWKDGRPVRGRVLRTDGTPVAGVWVGPAPEDARTRIGQLNWLSKPVMTDAEGRFAFESVAPGPVVVRAWEGSEQSPRQALVERRVEIPDAGSAPEVDLVVGNAAARRIRVHVGDAEGLPIGHADVRWVTTDRSQLASGLTGADGEVVLEAAGEEGTWILVDHLSYAPWRVLVDHEVLAAGRIDLRMPAGKVRGHALRLDGSPARALKVRIALLVPRAGVPAWSDSIQGNNHVETDGEGRFEFLGLGDGAYHVDSPYSSWPPIGGGVRVRAGDDDVKLVVGTAEETHDMRVEVEVVDSATGKPVENWIFQVQLFAAGADRTGPPLATLQTIQGSTSVYHTFFPWPAGAYDVVAPRTMGFRETVLSGVRIGPGVEHTRKRLSLDRGESVRGRVLDAAGLPAKGVRIEIGGQDAAVVGADGTYDATGLDAGVVDVRVAGKYAESEIRRVDVRAGEPATADFRVTTGGAIRIEVPAGARPATRVRATAVPVAGGAAAAFDLDAAEYAEIARKQGLLFPRLPPGRYRVEVTWDGRTVVSEEVAVADRATTRVEARP